jgi:uncharacterized membrane-anchored protein YjiN (DUF445 family)
MCMSQRPARQRRLALTVLLAAAGLAVAAVPFRATWWGGWVLAIAEAGIVGGLADWFAVTALFRRPLGLPIPHTALIPANWELMARRVGVMVGDRVLTKDYVTRELAQFDVAGLLARAAYRLEPADLEAAVRTLARWAAAEISSTSSAELVGWLRRFLAAQPLAPLLATVLEVARRQGWDQRLIEAAARALIEALDRPEFRKAVGELVDGVLESYRARLGAYPRFLMGLANVFGLIDRERLVGALHTALQRVAEDPDDPLRQPLSAAVAELPERLRTDPELAARVESVKRELAESPGMTRLLDGAAAGLRAAVLGDLSDERSELIAWSTDRLDRARRQLASDEQLGRALDRWIKQRLIDLVERYHDRIATFIERGVHALGPEGAVRLIEEHAGDDLQYIRVNGTVVGGLAGGGIYGVHLLLQLL